MRITINGIEFKGLRSINYRERPGPARVPLSGRNRYECTWSIPPKDST